MSIVTNESLVNWWHKSMMNGQMYGYVYMLWIDQTNDVWNPLLGMFERNNVLIYFFIFNNIINLIYS